MNRKLYVSDVFVRNKKIGLDCPHCKKEIKLSNSVIDNINRTRISVSLGWKPKKSKRAE